MTRRRWIADEISGNHASLVGSHAEHLSRVLRAQTGQEFDIVADGVLRRSRISSVAHNRVDFELGEEIPATVSSNIALLISVFKFDRMEWAIEKCTELGATRIIPIVAQRTEAHLAKAAAKRVERWRRIALQASEQSRRLAPPEITTPFKLKDALVLSGGTRLLLNEAEEIVSLKDALEASDGNELLLAFGPEGGWTETEVKLFQEAGWISVSLGQTILRAETAIIAATAIAQAL